MRNARILFRNEEASILTQHDNGSYSFLYNQTWISDSNKQSISLTLPKTKQEFHSSFLFPFFFNMLPEGSNKQTACKLNRIDLEDHFGLLMIATKIDSIGAVRVIKIEME